MRTLEKRVLTGLLGGLETQTPPGCQTSGSEVFLKFQVRPQPCLFWARFRVAMPNVTAPPPLPRPRKCTHSERKPPLTTPEGRGQMPGAVTLWAPQTGRGDPRIPVTPGRDVGGSAGRLETRPPRAGSRRFTVYVPDLPGVGSRRPDPGLGLEGGGRVGAPVPLPILARSRPHGWLSPGAVARWWAA